MSSLLSGAYKVKLDELGGMLKIWSLLNEHGHLLGDEIEKTSFLNLLWLKQAPRAWYDMLSSFLISNDFSKGSVDPTLFIRREGNELILVGQSIRMDIIFDASTQN
ncbi:hypothetical protein Tco_0569429 [Tanacetum coccineum]